MNYCHKYRKEIFGNFGVSDLESFVDSIYEEALIMQDLFLDFKDNYLGKQNHRLQDIFLPLDNSNYRLSSLQVSKAKVPSKDRPNIYPVLRLYSIKISDSTFIVTAGCLKFTFSLSGTDDCSRANSRTNMVRDWLKQESYETQDDITYYYESN